MLASYVLYRSRSGFNSVDRYGIYAGESPRWLISRGRDEEGKSRWPVSKGMRQWKIKYKPSKNELIKSEKISQVLKN